MAYRVEVTVKGRFFGWVVIDPEGSTADPFVTTMNPDHASNFDDILLAGCVASWSEGKLSSIEGAYVAVVKIEGGGAPQQGEGNV